MNDLGHTTKPGDLADLARRIATEAHEGQVDKADRPYITHPARVAARVADRGAEFEAVAWLHDVLEDTTVDAERLRAEGIPEAVIVGVESVTKRTDPKEDHLDAVRRAAQDPLGLVVKAADVADNSDPARLALLDEPTRTHLTDKYRKAWALLDELGAPRFD